MEVSKQRLQQLLETENWSPEDRRWLLHYLENNDTSLLQQILQEDFKENAWDSAFRDEESARRLLHLIHDRIQSSASAKIIRLRFWKRIAVAAAIVLLLGAGSYALFSESNKKTIAKTNTNAPQKIDLPPGGNKAVLTLGDNRTIVLDNAQNGAIAEQGNTKILKLNDGQLAYNLLNEKPPEVLHNTVTTPRGGQYQLTLADGSKVWLNAASSIRFPTAFVGNERKVEITGEAYFEVAKNPAMPFKVEVNGKQEVEVLGTHFNVNAYSDEPTINTTLLEGSVKVTSLTNHDSRLITPGQQSQINNLGQISIDKNADMEEVMAWKNGWFNFNSTGLEDIMRQISRWYDVDITYSGTISHETFTAMVRRSSNISGVLKIMEENGIKFRIEGKKIVVLE